MRYRFIRDNATDFSVRTLYRVIRVSASAWYASPGGDSCQGQTESARSRTLVKKLREEGTVVSRWRVRKLMQEESLVSQQRRAYKVTTKPKAWPELAPNLLSQNFNPPGPDQVWVSDITYRVPGIQGKYGRSNEP